MIWTFEHISMFQTRKSMIKPSQIHLQLRRKQTSLEDGMQYAHTKPTCTNSGSQALVLPPPGVHCRITKFTSPQNTNPLDHLQSSNVQNTELLEMVCESKKKNFSAISTLKDSLRCHISSASVSALFVVPSLRPLRICAANLPPHRRFRGVASMGGETGKTGGAGIKNNILPNERQVRYWSTYHVTVYDI